MAATSDTATALEDGLLQDLVAVGLIVRVLRRSLDGCCAGGARTLLDAVSATLDADVRQLRSANCGLDRLPWRVASRVDEPHEGNAPLAVLSRPGFGKPSPDPESALR